MVPHRATGLAYLIKEFCRTTVPEAFEDEAGIRLPTPSVPRLRPQAKFGIAERMAGVIAKLMRENDSCMPQDIIAEGFSAEEVERHWAMARALAQVELNMMDS